jgi:hypothetical protein
MKSFCLFRIENSQDHKTFELTLHLTLAVDTVSNVDFSFLIGHLYMTIHGLKFDHVCSSSYP